MSLRAILFTSPAERQLDEVLEDSEEHFGATARERYEALFVQAFDDLLDNPGRPGVREVDGRVHYHLRHSRNRVPKKSDRVSRPRHLIVARVIDDTLVVLAVAHDAMEDELMARVQKGEANL